jgi:colicin import membrane protein
MIVITRPVRIGAAAGVLLLCAAGARSAAPTPAELDQRYPKGSISSAVDAQRALADATAAGQALDRAFESERARCARVFLATQCLDEARRAHARGTTRIRRVEIEAHDLQRREAADVRQARRDSAAVPAERSGQAAQSPAQPSGRTGGAARSPAPPVDPARQRAQEIAAREQYEQRITQHKHDEAHQVEIQIRNGTGNARKFREKQEQAKAYAAEKARAREENEKSRAEKEQERRRKFGTADTEAGAEAAPGGH